MQVSIDSAKSDLVELIAAALRGEDAVIAEGTTPVVRLVPVGKKKFKLGIWGHKLMGPVPDFLEPMSEEELALWEGGNSPVCVSTRMRGLGRFRAPRN